jgi:hypothetical protein
LLLEAAAAGGELCRRSGAAADGFEGAVGIEDTSLGGTVGEFAASLAAGAGGSGGDSAAGAVADGGVIGGGDARVTGEGVAAESACGAIAC